ncbi:WD40-repeat-containing domain protein [Apodospora peruviana]|uniref:WD40-repeat-containing domain protein n=1 Tax=Apodospora peruviana TaxID=516989 RepID=A0AAE0M4F3_9PEZI|nr:WD40-repeat-containing domain protein [Apodospora peruviana]
MEHPSLDLVAATGNPDGSFPASGLRDLHSSYRKPQSFFKSVQWSVDGTTLFTSSSENRICSFMLPNDLLEPRQEPAILKPQGTIVLAEPTSAIALCPYYALERPSTQVILTASLEHPIHLHHAFPQSSDHNVDTTQPSSTAPQQSKPLASYRLIKSETEQYLPVASLIWPNPGTHFIAGTTNKIALFDVSRPDSMMSSQQPVLTISTIPAMSNGLAHSFGMRGRVSALAMSEPGGDGGGGSLLAAGNWNRQVGLYDLNRAGGDCVATWSAAGAATENGIGGNGIMQTIWSPCGRYLVVNERQSTGLLVYDLRGTHQLIACLKGRDGDITQRLACDVFPGSDNVGGFEVWAGTKDGSVVVWEGIGIQGGTVAPSWERKLHESAIGATAMHMSGSVVATCSGSWKFMDYSESSDDDSDDDDDSEDSDSDEGNSGGDLSSSEEEESCGSEDSEIRIRGPRPLVVVDETSLKVWSIRVGGAGGTQPETGQPETEQRDVHEKTFEP